MAARRVYQEWERANAVAMYQSLTDAGQCDADARRLVAHRLGIPTSTIRNWIASSQLATGSRTPDTSEPRASRPRWFRRPAAWVATALSAVVTAALIAAFAPKLSNAVVDALASGLPIDIDSVLELRTSRSGDSVVLPRGLPFSSADLAELNRLRDDDPGSQASWLESRGGIAVNAVYIELVVSGNRSRQVRIIDVETRSECTNPADGTFFENPPAGQDDTVPLLFDLDRPGSPAMVDENGITEDYFPNRTISLGQDEQQVLLVIASTADQRCSFDLLLTVLDQDTRVPVVVTLPDGESFEVTAQLPNSSYEAVYLGGVVCDPWVQASEAYIRGDEAAACVN